MKLDPTPRPTLRLVVDPIPNQPWLNREAGARAVRMFEHPRWFPELTGHALAGPTARLRGRRSSRRRAWALMAASIARHTDRRTFRIGDQRDDGLSNGVSIARYQKETGLSRWVVGAVLREFEAAAFVVTHDQPVELLKDHKGCARKGACSCPPLLDAKGRPRHRGFAAQRQVTALFFQRLGFTAAKIKKARARGYAEWTKRRAPVLSAVAILGGRRDVRRLLRANQQRAERLGQGAQLAPAAAPPAPPARTPAHLVDANEARERRLAGLPPPDTGDPAKPRSSS